MEKIKWTEDHTVHLQRSETGNSCLPADREKEHAMGNSINVCIGTDSQVKGACIEFATVIVFVRKGNGGFMFINKEIVMNKMNIKERMMQEVARSIDVAYEISPVLEHFDINVEVHVDINTNEMFKSNTALKDAAGYVSGMGFMFKAKPQAFASSNCANKMVQSKVLLKNIQWIVNRK